MLTRWTLMAVASVAAMGCTLGSPPQLHYPNRAGNVDGYGGYSLPLQRARARVMTQSDGRVHDVTGNTAAIVPEIPLTAVAYLYDPKLFLSVGVTDQLTAAADASWHRMGLSAHYFTSRKGAPGLKLAAGVSAGPFVREVWGWAEVGALPALSNTWSGHIALGAAAGRFRHFLTVPDAVAPPPDEGTIPTVQSFIDLLREEVRVRLPLGLSARFREISIQFALTPSLTLLHAEPDAIACRDFTCGDVTLLEFSQVFAMELQAGFRF